MTLASALLLGIYDIFKKQALKHNGVLWVLLAATAFSTLAWQAAQLIPVTLYCFIFYPFFC